LAGTPLATGFTALIHTCQYVKFHLVDLYSESIQLIDSVLGDMLIHERDIRRKPPTNPEAILEALKKVRTFQSRIKAILDNLPRVFQFLEQEKDVYVAIVPRCTVYQSNMSQLGC
jgi:hypothetical protein